MASEEAILALLEAGDLQGAATQAIEAFGPEVLGFAWNDIARVVCEDTLETDEDLTRAAARLRKRFELVKNEIRERAQEAGLVGRDGEA